MDPLFDTYRLNEEGQHKLLQIGELFSATLKTLRGYCAENTREFAIVQTHLQDAKLHAVIAMCMKPEHQDVPGRPAGQTRYEHP
jgi:hypothetical protein